MSSTVTTTARLASSATPTSVSVKKKSPPVAIQMPEIDSYDRRSISPTNQTPCTSSGSSFRQRSSIKQQRETDQSSAIEVTPTDGKASTWKNSKLFSRTLSTIEVRKQGRKSPTNSGQIATSPTIGVGGTRATLALTSGKDSPAVLSVSNRRPSPVDISISPPTTPPPSPSADVKRERSNKAISEWKSLRNKLTSLRKKTNTDSGDNTSGEQSTASRKNSASKSSSRGSRSGSQDEGIVCKKEDLIFLLQEAAKQVSKQKHLNEQRNQSPTKITPNGDDEPVVMKIVSKKSDTSSDNNLNQTAECVEYQETTVYVPNIRQNVNTVSLTAGESGNDEMARRKSHSEIDVVLCDENAGKDTNNDIGEKSVECGNFDDENQDEVPTAAVKWDESNVVDAMILGDAIQAFLRGMGGGGSEKKPITTEKKVSFKKN